MAAATSEELQAVVQRIEALEAWATAGGISAQMRSEVLGIIEERTGMVKAVMKMMGQNRDGGERKIKAFKAADLIPNTWTGPLDKIPFTEYASDLHNYMLAVHDNGDELLKAVEAMDTWEDDVLSTVEPDAEEIKRISRDLYTNFGRLHH